MPFALPPMPTPQVEIGIASDYMSKGVSQTDGKGAIMGRVTIPLTPNFYVGGFAVNNNRNTSGQNAEVQAFAGFKFNAWSTAFDLRGIYKTYPGTIDHLKSHEADVLATATHDFTPKWQGKLSVEYTPDQHQVGGHSVYTEGDLGYRITPRDMVSAGYGYRAVEFGHNYSAYNVGYTRDLTDHVAIDARWYNTDLNADRFGRKYGSRAVIALRTKF